MGHGYALAGERRKALGTYGRYITRSRIDITTLHLKGIDSIISTEVNNLVYLGTTKSKGQANIENMKTVYWPVRILVEWNNSEAEFDIQFVNPDNRYFSWNHTREKSLERIRDEKSKGYSSEQFLIDDNLKGEWKVNLKYHGNKGYDPTYFKVTIYNDYGKPSQRKDLEVFQASEKNLSKSLLSIAVN